MTPDTTVDTSARCRVTFDPKAQRSLRHWQYPGLERACGSRPVPVTWTVEFTSAASVTCARCQKRLAAWAKRPREATNHA